jgi:DNA ligase (NAD+)
MSQLKKNILKILNDPYNVSLLLPINELTDVLIELSNVYYNTGKDIVSDEIFDILKDSLLTRDPNNDFLKKIGAPINTNNNMVKLPYFAGSLDKIKPNTNELSNWLIKYTGPYIISDKLDGVSGLLEMTKNGLKLYTRGNGDYGQDISHLLPYVLPNTLIPIKIPIGTVIRGELIINKQNFNKISSKMATSRSAVSGLVNSKKSSFSIEIAKITEYVAYSLINVENKHQIKYSEQIIKLSEYGFKLVNCKKLNDITNDILSDMLDKRRINSNYDIDGIVISDDSNIYKCEKKNPKHSFAFKTISNDNIAETTVIDIIWEISMDGYLKPVINTIPVTISGTTIQFITAYNAKYIIDNLIGIGSIVQIIKGGEVIPKVHKVIKTISKNLLKMPNIKYEWTDTDVDIIAINPTGDYKLQMITKQIVHFFKTINVKFISDGIIMKLVENGFDNIVAIINCDLEDWIDIDGIGEKMSKKIQTNIKNSLLKAELHELMAASHYFGRGFGIKKLKLITDEYPNIMNSKLDTSKLIESIENIHGFSLLTATQFAENFKIFKAFLCDLNKVSNLKKINSPNTAVKNIANNKNGMFKNNIVLFTGFRDDTIKQFIIKEGGNITDTFNNKITLLLYDDSKPISNKLKKATDNNIQIMTKNKFYQLYL